VKRFSLSLVLVVAIAAMSSAAALAAPPNLTGNWTVEQTGANGTTSSTISLTQSGMGVVGTNAKTGNGFTGTFVTDSQLNGKWHGPGGAGWLTVYVSPNGHSFNGSWGYNGRKENGNFVANKILPPKPITTAGSWNVAAVTGPKIFGGPMTCTQSGPTSICQLSGGTLNGKFRTTNKVRYKWTSKTQNGWFSFWFNDDGQSFNGTWGYGADTTPTMGRVVGQRPAGSNM
jgi:hypothetical protein